MVIEGNCFQVASKRCVSDITVNLPVVRRWGSSARVLDQLLQFCIKTASHSPPLSRAESWRITKLEIPDMDGFGFRSAWASASA